MTWVNKTYHHFIFRPLAIFVLLCCCSVIYAQQDSALLKVHFLYGSKPRKEYRDTESKWFGGVLGGHVGIEGDSNSIVSFFHEGNVHVFAKKKKRHSEYKDQNERDFYAVLGETGDSVKSAVVYIPVSMKQKQEFDSLAAAYLKLTPYDYAFFGMRCAAAAHDILGKIDVMTNYNYQTTWRKIFYPKKLRKRLFKKAGENGWFITTQQGSGKRKWDNH